MIAVQAGEADGVQILSLAASVLATGVISAITDRDYDTNPRGRKQEPKYFGYIPSEPWSQSAAMLGVTLWIAGCNAAKMASLGVLLSASPILTVAWLCAECAALLGLRMLTQDGQWRFSASGSDGVVMSLVTHFCDYASMLAAPMPLTRHPAWLGLRAWSIGVAYSLAINPVIMLVGFRIDRSDGGRSAIGATASVMGLVLFAATAVAVCGAMIAWRCMDASHRPTFYRHESCRQQTDWMWENRTTAPRGSGRDAARAHVLVSASWRYWPPADKVKAWLSQWDEWEREPPEWFSPWWRRRARRTFPPGFLPDAARERLERERAEWRRQRREAREAAHGTNNRGATTSIVATPVTEIRPSSGTTVVSPAAASLRGGDAAAGHTKKRGGGRGGSATRPSASAVVHPLPTPNSPSPASP